MVNNNNESLKYISLIVLCLQNSMLALLMRLTQVGNHEKFNKSTAVITAEMLKVIASIVLVIKDHRESQDPNKLSAYHVIWNAVSDTREMGRIAIPACLYLLQNNLAYVAISNLDAATYQVLYQLKIFTTAVFSVTMLQKRIIPAQWGGIVTLMMGVALVQTDETPSHIHQDTSQQNVFVGLISILIACTCSGFAGVYFEKILKNKATKATIWERNIQMGLISTVLGLIALYSSQPTEVLGKGFFSGYRSIVWSAITVNALGGLLTAVVVKYADNILKAFATSISIILSVIVSIFLFGKIPTLQFLFGAGLVNAAVYIYGVSPSWKTKRSISKNEAKEEVELMILDSIDDKKDLSTS